MFVCVYVIMCTYKEINVIIYKQKYETYKQNVVVCMYMYECKYVYIFVCMYVSMYVCMYVSMYACTCIYVCMYVCMHVCMYV